MVWIDKIFAKLLFWLYDFLDAICEIFSILAGTETFTYEGDENVSLIDVFVEHSAITQVFLAVFLVSIAVVAIFTIVGMVKNVIAIKAENRHSQGHTFGLGLTALLASLLMFAVLLMGIQLSNEVLCLINQSFGNSSDMTLSQQLFEISVSETYDKVEISPDDAELEDYVVIDDGNILYVFGDGSLQKYFNESQSLYYYMIDGSWKAETACEILASSALSYGTSSILINGYYKLSEGEYTESAFQDLVYGGVEYGDWYANYDDESVAELYVAYVYDGSARAITSGWQNGYSASDIDFSSMSVDDVFGVYNTNMIGFEIESKGINMATKSTRMVDLGSFNLFTAYLAVIIILVALIWAMIGLVKRIYDILFLIVVLPLITATLPIDEGARFKSWRDTMASKVLLAYGAVISVNIFLIMLPVIGSVCDAIYFTTKYSGKILEIMLYAGGALSISGGQLLLSRLLGTDASESRDLANSARTALGVAGGVASVAGIGKRAIFGGTNKYGRERKGIISASLTPVNAAAEKIGGERYMQSRAGSAMRTLGRVKPTEARAAAAEAGKTQRAENRAAKKTANSENKEKRYEQGREAQATNGKLRTQGASSGNPIKGISSTSAGAQAAPQTAGNNIPKNLEQSGYTGTRAGSLKPDDNLKKTTAGSELPGRQSAASMAGGTSIVSNNTTTNSVHAENGGGNLIKGVPDVPAGSQAAGKSTANAVPRENTAQPFTGMRAGTPAAGSMRIENNLTADKQPHAVSGDVAQASGKQTADPAPRTPEQSPVGKRAGSRKLGTTQNKKAATPDKQANAVNTGGDAPHANGKQTADPAPRTPGQLSAVMRAGSTKSSVSSGGQTAMPDKQAHSVNAGGDVPKVSGKQTVERVPRTPETGTKTAMQNNAVTQQPVSRNANTAAAASTDGGTKNTGGVTPVVNIMQPNPLTGSTGVQPATNNSKHAKDLVGNTLEDAKKAKKGSDSPGSKGEGE